MAPRPKTDTFKLWTLSFSTAFNRHHHQPLTVKFLNHLKLYQVCSPLCTYEGRIPYTLAILSLVVLPLVGEIWLLVKVTRISYLSIGAILFNLVVGITASYYTRMLRLKHGQPPARGGLILPE